MRKVRKLDVGCSNASCKTYRKIGLKNIIRIGRAQVTPVIGIRPVLESVEDPRTHIVVALPSCTVHHYCTHAAVVFYDNLLNLIALMEQRVALVDAGTKKRV